MAFASTSLSLCMRCAGLDMEVGICGKQIEEQKWYLWLPTTGRLTSDQGQHPDCCPVPFALILHYRPHAMWALSFIEGQHNTHRPCPIRLEMIQPIPNPSYLLPDIVYKCSFNPAQCAPLVLLARPRQRHFTSHVMMAYVLMFGATRLQYDIHL